METGFCQSLVIRHSNSIDVVTSRKFMAMAALSVNNLDEVFELVEEVSNITLTEVFCYIIAKFKLLDKKSFDKWYLEYMDKLTISSKYRATCDLLIDYLNTNYEQLPPINFSKSIDSNNS